jgi:hypothetical protein
LNTNDLPLADDIECRHAARVREGVVNMEKTLFDDLMQSLKEAKAISKGRAKASRRLKSRRPMSRRCGSRSGCRKASLQS